MCQNTVESTEDLVSEHGVTADEVQRGTIALPAYLAAALENMGDSLYRPPTGSAALGSAPCLAARVLLEGHLGVEHLTDQAVRDPAMLALADRLEVTLDDDPAAAGLPVAEQPTTVTVTTARGTFTASHGFAAGHPSRLTEAHILKKFSNNMRLVTDAATADAVAATMSRLAELLSVADITAAINDINKVSA